MPEKTRVQQELWRVYRRLDPSLLQADDEPDRGAHADLAQPGDRTGLVFGTYTRGGLEKALRAYGTLQRLQARGLGPLDVRLDMTDIYRPSFSLESRRFGGRPVLAIEMSAATGSVVGFPEPLGTVPMLYLESLLLQHPGKRFSWSRPPLPEQEFPGLALSGEILQLLLLLAKRVGVEALVLRPSTFHAASIYARYFHFVDGRAGGRFESLRRDPRLRPLWLLSWALDLGCVRRDGEPVSFAPDPMAAPLSSRVASHFARSAWRRDWELGRAERHTLDLACLRQRFPWDQMPPGPPPASLRNLLRPPPRPSEGVPIL
jgi:hypothetical protein